MKPAWLKTILPRSLYGRAALILIVPVVMIQLVVSVTFIQRHYEGVTQQMTGNILIEVKYILGEVDAAPDLAAAQKDARMLAARLDMQVMLPAPDVTGDRINWADFSGQQMLRTLRAALPGLQAVDLLADSRAVRITIATPWGPMRVIFPRERVSASNPHQLLVLMIFTSILMTLIAYMFLRNQLRPITRLAAAAEAFGKGQAISYRPRGANEVRAAGLSFLEMRARIERQIEQRTLMLSGVSHDLRTPLTRLKLGLAMLEDTPDVADLRRDVEDMERLLDAFLAFARGDAMEETAPTDLPDLIRRVVDDAARGGKPVALGQIEGRGAAPIRPHAVRRAVENLVGNAVRYARHVEVGLVMTDRQIRIVVEDDGPGIPPEKREEAMRPFIRLDAARNQDRGSGVGLGLSIAADVARSHGGSLRLGQSDRLGGLRAELVLAR
ncbi:MAG: two-component sensor histidine kinase [Paracoccaceae bacterium]|nr:two-component sensor histidine kinase [Paracoccaceae bacterium]MDE3239063.1 two-component sensor histidine kinase [Paracoccaceae bacterium]